jgi:hypothetical protein
MSVEADVAGESHGPTLGQERLTTSGLVAVAPRAARDVAYVLLALTAVVWSVIWVRGAVDTDTVGFDFLGTLWEPGRAILDGRSPYPPPEVSALQVGNPAIYPPLLMVLVAPLTVLPWGLGLALWTALLAAALVGSLRALGVRDPRCYALALISAPAMGSFTLGNATLLLLPLVALAWRWRERWLRAGALVGVAIAAKLLLWPLLFWLVATRRYRAAAASAATIVAGLVVPWAVIGLDGLREYPHLLRVATDLYAVHSYSLATVAGAAGVGARGAAALATVVGLVLGLVALHIGRRGNDGASLSLALLAAVVASPILWSYYFVFLLVPLAIARPRFSGLWALLPLFWLVQLLPRERLQSSDFAEGGVACCRPPGVPSGIWEFNHSPPRVWPALGLLCLGTGLVLLCIRSLGAGRESARFSEDGARPMRTRAM